MKKILLIGKFNKIIENLEACLASKFHVQLCSESVELVQGMMKIVKPNMVIVCAIEQEDIDTKVMELLTKRSYSGIPILVIGTKGGCDKFQDYYQESQCEYLVRPISKAMLLEKCCELLKISEPDGEAKQINITGSVEEVYKRKSILVVDDSALALRSIKAMLDKQYNVVVATSGKMAMDIIKKKRPDLILLDYEMPGWDGKTTLEKIRNDAEIQDIPVIFLTGLSDKKHITAALSLNPAGYFLKPLEKDKVLKAIENILAENPSLSNSDGE